MNRYIPNTRQDTKEMLEAIGLKSIDELFSMIPSSCFCKASLNLPGALSEWELNAYMDELAGRNGVFPDYRIFLGAGRYLHFIPAHLNYLLSRSEFITSYTPYQPEISQGTLQAIYEYQSYICRLTRMDVATASHYDGATAFAEAMLMAVRITRKKRVAVSRAINPFYRRVLETYLRPTQVEITGLDYDETGATDLSGTGDDAAIAVQYPNFFGCMEPLERIGEKARAKGSLFVVAFTEPLCFGIYRPPGEFGADIVCGEGQSFGIPVSFGGPGLGILASKSSFLRNLPGRLVGRTKDVNGKDGFVLTLAAREQHIRRERATSNICTNNSLCAIAALIYLASLGRSGLTGLARTNYSKAEYLKAGLLKAGCRIPFSRPTFNEFVVEFPADVMSLYRRLLEKKIVAGLPLSPYFPELSNHSLISVTEICSKRMMDEFIEEVTR